MLAKMCYHIVVLFLCIICSSLASIVTFLPTTSFYLPINFKDGELPCSKETVIFPETLLSSVRLESKTSVSGFILPKDGDIILDDGTVVFGTDEGDFNCIHERNIYYLERAIAAWSEPDIWDSPRFNDATPDAERVPCFDDIVEFPTNSEFVLTVPDELQYVSGIRLGNYTCLTTTAFVDQITKAAPAQQFIFNSFLTLGLGFKQEQCMSRAGCLCQKHPLKIKCEIKHCAVPTCVDPIKPEGHCCKICGGVIVFDIDESFDLMMFKELVEKNVESYGVDNLEYHIGRLPLNKIQLVVVDKEEYFGTSAEVVNAIDHQMIRHWVQGAKFVGISGSPLYKSGLGGKIFVSMFFLVVLFMGGIYVYYYKLPKISDLRFPIIHRTSPGVFSRFQSRTDSVVCLTRTDPETSIGISLGTAFRNPLYESTRQRIEVEEIGADE